MKKIILKKKWRLVTHLFDILSGTCKKSISESFLSMKVSCYPASTVEPTENIRLSHEGIIDASQTIRPHLRCFYQVLSSTYIDTRGTIVAESRYKITKANIIIFRKSFTVHAAFEIKHTSLFLCSSQVCFNMFDFQKKIFFFETNKRHIRPTWIISRTFSNLNYQRQANWNHREGSEGLD